MNVSIYSLETKPVEKVRDFDALWEARRRLAEKAFAGSRFRNVEELGGWSERENQRARSFWVEDASAEEGRKEMTFVVEFKRNSAVTLNSYFIDEEAF